MKKIHIFKVCDDGTLVQILRFWALSIVLFYQKHRPVYFSKHNFSETGFCLHLQAKPTQLGPINKGSPCIRTGLQRGTIDWTN
jgi:hypothetical protein